MPLSPEIVTVLSIFQSAFTSPTWEKVQVLVVGTLLARGRRTVTAALRQMGRGQEEDFSLYHQVLNRARWSALELSRLLLHALIKAFVTAGGSLTFVIDEHLERRWGPQIRKRGHFRDSLLSSRKKSVSNSGLRWIVLSLVVNVPWTKHCVALPVLSVAGSFTESQPATQAPPQNGRSMGAANDHESATLRAGRPHQAAR